MKETTVEEILPVVLRVLDENGVQARQGYGDVYHFYHLLGQDHRIKIPERFVLGSATFVVARGELILIENLICGRTKNMSTVFLMHDVLYGIHFRWNVFFLAKRDSRFL